MHTLQRTAGNAYVNRMLRKLSAPELNPGQAELDRSAAGDHSDPERVAEQLGPGRPLDPSVRSRMGPALGADFGSVRLHDDAASANLTSSLGARAMTVGEHVAFAPNQYRPGTPLGDALIAHELAHVIQQSDVATVSRSAAPGAQLEADAASAAAGALHVLHGGAAGRRGRAALRSGLRLQRCDVKKPFPNPKTITDAASATKAMEAYLSQGAADRRATIKAVDKKDLAAALKLLPAADQIGKYSAALAEIGRIVEEEETHAASGMTDDQIAATQRDFIKKKAEDAAKAEALKNAPPAAPPPPAPAPAQVEAERKKIVEKQALPQPVVGGWDALPAADKANWTTRATNAIAKVVTYANAHYPELGITAANFKIAFKEIEARGATVVAAGSPAQIGFAFVTAVEANPAYVMDVVVHEVYGHPGYGPYGTEYHLALYDKAMATMPGYTKPAGGTQDRTNELDAYAYQETEMYAIMRGSPYRTAPTPADVGKVPALDPQGLIDWHVGIMKDEWAPTLLVPILRGYRMRLVVDPRITGTALHIFDTAMTNKLDAATVAAVMK
jgi:Domain of unknown function (DUF4157)